MKYLTTPIFSRIDLLMLFVPMVNCHCFYWIIDETCGLGVVGWLVIHTTVATWCCCSCLSCALFESELKTVPAWHDPLLIKSSLIFMKSL